MRTYIGRTARFLWSGTESHYNSLDVWPSVTVDGLAAVCSLQSSGGRVYPRRVLHVPYTCPRSASSIQPGPSCLSFSTAMISS